MLQPNLTSRWRPPKPYLSTIISSSASSHFDARPDRIGIPTRYGNFPAQWKAFWDQTGGLWAKQTLAGKKFGVFVSTAVQGGGQELTAFQSLSVAIHHGMVFVPIGYQITESTDLSELHGGSPWGTRLVQSDFA